MCWRSLLPSTTLSLIRFYDALAWAGFPEVDLSFLGLLSYIGVIAMMVQILEMVLGRFVPVLYNALDYVFALDHRELRHPGCIIDVDRPDQTFGERRCIWFGCWGRLGFGNNRFGRCARKTKYSDVPEGLRGLGITFISVGLISLCFMSFGGIDI